MAWSGENAFLKNVSLRLWFHRTMIRQQLFKSRRHVIPSTLSGDHSMMANDTCHVPHLTEAAMPA